MTKRLLLGLFLLLWASPAHAGLILTDTFTEAVDIDLDDHTSDTGQTWALSTAAGFRVIAATDVAIGNNASVRRATNSADLGTPDIVVEADIAITSSAGAAVASIYAREASATTFADNYNCGIYDDTAGAGGSVDIGLLSRVAGADGTLDEIIDFNGTIGTVYHVRLSVVGTKVECCVNHTSCITATGQTELTTGNFVGMKTIPSTATTFDNLKAYTYSRGKMTE